MSNYKTINLKPETYEKLKKLKIIPEEPYDRVVTRVINTSSLLPKVFK